MRQSTPVQLPSNLSGPREQGLVAGPLDLSEMSAHDVQKPRIRERHRCEPVQRPGSDESLRMSRIPAKDRVNAR